MPYEEEDTWSLSLSRHEAAQVHRVSSSHVSHHDAKTKPFPFFF